MILSLWLVVVQMRYDDWKDDPNSVRRAYGVGLYFSLPGIMTLISLVDPTNPYLWRTSYAIVALGGAGVLGVVYKRHPGQGRSNRVPAARSFSTVRSRSSRSSPIPWTS